MFCDFYAILFLFVRAVSSCGNVTWSDGQFGHVENWNFFLGQSQPKNLSCAWRISRDEPSDLIVSLRIVEVESDRKRWTNELILKSDQSEIRVNDLSQRSFYFPSISTLQIDFPVKGPMSPSSGLNIHRFFLEFTRVNKHSDGGFRCTKTGRILPQRWRCNCLYECGPHDFSDEEDCPLCEMVRSSNSLVCRSNESWCLPPTSPAESKGICLTSGETAQCAYQTQCETIVAYSGDRGEILLNDLLLSNRMSLCFVIMTKEKHHLRLIIDQRSDLEFVIYDGDQAGNILLASSYSLLNKQMVQTRQSHTATIVIHQRSIDAENSPSDQLVLNITWMTSICLENQFLCSGHFERKCYSKQQRCDGIWDCISGDDELGCLPASCPTTFACHNRLRSSSDHPRCYTWFERCNGNAFCPNRTDEQNCDNWWCNSNNGTFLCQNRNCIYEIWRCDGSDDCGDNSDEVHCSSQISRRVITAATLGVTICCTLFLIVLGCTCKLVYLRSAERRASTRLSNPQLYLEHRQSDESQRVAPPTYNQTMGFSNENDDRHTILAEQLRLAGLASFIPSTSRRQRREDSRDSLIEPQSNRFDLFRSLFAQSLSINNNRIPTDEIAITERRTSSEARELPPPYSEGRVLSPPLATAEETEQANSDADDDDKMLVP